MSDVMLWLVLIASVALNAYSLQQNWENRRELRRIRVNADATARITTLRWDRFTSESARAER